MYSKPITGWNLHFLGTPHLFHKQAKCLQVNLSPFWRELHSIFWIIIKTKIHIYFIFYDTNFWLRSPLQKGAKITCKKNYAFSLIME